MSSKYHQALSLKVLKKLARRLKPSLPWFALVSVIGIALAALDMIPPKLVGLAINRMSAGAFTMRDIWPYLAAWAVIAFSTQAIHGAQIALASRVGERVLAKLRIDLFSHVQKLSLRFFDRTEIGRLLTAFGSDIDSLRSLAVWGANTITSNAAFLIFSAVMIYRTDRAIFFAIVWLAPLMTALNFLYGQRLSRSWQKIRASSSAIGTNQAENIAGARVVQAFNRQEDNLLHYNELLDMNATTHVELSRENGLFQPALQWVRFLGQAIVLSFGGYRVVSGQMTPGDLVSVSLYWEWFVMPSMNFGGFLGELIVASSGAERVFSVLEENLDLKSNPNAEPIKTYSGNLKFEGVNFSYLPGRRVLKDVSFSIPAGKTVALVGATGSGKTTLLGLLARFFDAESGEIFFDDKKIEDITPESLSRHIAYVPQANFLFNGTVMENLRYDRLAITDEEVFAATRALGCYERLLALQNGFETQVGEGGAALSLGERQLVCFARALVRRPQLLLLDEATSAMDVQTDQQVREALRKLSSGRTTFIVTHRLRTAVEADLVLMMENGRIIEQGSHDELLELHGAYAKLFTDGLRASRDFETEAVFEVELTEPIAKSRDSFAQMAEA